MKTKTFLFLLNIAIFLFSFVSIQPAAAHGDEPRIEINPDRLNPGSVLDIRGVDFEFEEEIILFLVSSQVEIPLGTVTADAEGVFLLTMNLPVDLAEGTYAIRAITDDHEVKSAPLAVWGSAVLGGGSDGPREEDDSLLAPMPTLAPGVSSTPLTQSTALETPVSKRNSSTLIYSILAGVVILALLSIRILKKR